MKKIIYILLTIVFFNCKSDNCDINFNTKSYSAFGIVSFQKSFTGSIRHIDFYPICNFNENYENISDLKFKNGIALNFSGEKSTKFWQNLICDKRIKLNKENYGLALVYLDLTFATDDSEDILVYNNSFFFNQKNIKVKVYNIHVNKAKINSYKIIKPIN
jgi:hypothetical protein